MNNILRNFLFPSDSLSPSSSDWIILAIRLVFGTLLLVHGIQKIMSYDELSTSFADPVGLGSKLSLQLVIFAEFFCSLGVISGLLFRLALIPMIFAMCVAAFVAMKGMPWGQRELPVSYLLVFIILFVSGPGRLSFDALICRWLRL